MSANFGNSGAIIVTLCQSFRSPAAYELTETVIPLIIGS